MSTLHRWAVRMLILLVLVGIGLLTFAWLRSRHTGTPLFDFSVTRPLVVQPTPMRIQAIRSIGQWEFLSIDDEEVVDTIRRHWLGTDDQLVRIYRGTLRLGIDFAQCDQDWALAYGDTVRVRMPQVRLLDEHFIDEARTHSFYESGKWDAAVRRDMLRRAQVAMRCRCLTPENMQLAQQTAREQLQHFFLSLGYAQVVFEDAVE